MTFFITAEDETFSDGHMAHSATVDKIFNVTDNSNKGRHYILPSIRQDLFNIFLPISATYS
jgi:hypothetical protein